MRKKLQNDLETPQKGKVSTAPTEEEQRQIYDLRLQNPVLCRTCGTPMKKLTLGDVMMLDPDGEERPIPVYCNVCSK